VHRRGRRRAALPRLRAGIVGYTIFNDWSARDIQRLEGQLPFGFFKGKDGAHTLGPWLVTAHELEPYRTADGFLDLTMRAFVNGELLGEDSLAKRVVDPDPWPPIPAARRGQPRGPRH
jgi:2-keto-4-pentenoate hydratase/2-oxohepta-3-ene-1,7-dioic acid hydratase in catechol pathway